VQKLPRKVRSVLQASYALNDSTTFYTRYGDWLAYVCAIISAVAIILAFTPERGRRIA
jgi:apolipoprotein N-acyltransferase